MNIWKRQTGLCAGSLTFLLFGLAPLLLGLHTVRENLKFERSQQRLEAQILKKWNQDQYKKALPSRTPKVASTHDPIWFLQYKFTTPSGEERTETSAVARRTWQRMKVGQRIQLRWLEEYKEARPEIDTLTFLGQSLALFGFGIFFVILGVGIFFLAMRQIKREDFLRQQGRILIAESELFPLEKSPRFATLKGRYALNEGQSFLFEFHVGLGAGFNGPSKFPLELAVSPQDPTRFLVAGDLPEGLKIHGPVLQLAFSAKA